LQENNAIRKIAENAIVEFPDYQILVTQLVEMQISIDIGKKWENFLRNFTKITNRYFWESLISTRLLILYFIWSQSRSFTTLQASSLV